jgi:hypothetical protein
MIPDWATAVMVVTVGIRGQRHVDAGGPMAAGA